MTRRWERDEGGSIGVVMVVMLITTLLIAATALSVDRGHRFATRHGQSANALQAADAGINYLLKRVPDAPQQTGYAFSCPAGIRLGRATYTCMATFDRNTLDQIVWHLDSVSTDIQSGVKRRVRADAIAEPLFQRPIFVQANTGIKAGSIIESYIDGTTPERRCTKKGVLGINDPAKLKFTGAGPGLSNCQQTSLGLNWPYTIDGCNVYHADGTNPPTLAPQGQPGSIIGPAMCPPPPGTKTVTPEYPVKIPNSSDVTGPVVSGTKLECSSSMLRPGWTYIYDSAELRDGCAILNPVKDQPVTLFIRDMVLIGTTSGAKVNPPPTATTHPLTAGTICGSTATLAGGLSNYCPGWSASLIIHVTGTSHVKVEKPNTTFWGAINAPLSETTLDAPGVTLYGGLISNTLVNKTSTFTWRYDESLTKLGTGRFFLRNWREEPT